MEIFLRNIELDVHEAIGLESELFKKLVHERAREAYADKEAEFPVLAGLYRFTTRDAQGQKRYDRENLVAWARQRFHVEIKVDDLRNKQRDEIRKMLLEHSREDQERCGAVLEKAQTQVATLFGQESTNGAVAAAVSGGNGDVESLSNWLQSELHYELPVDDLAGLDREQLESRISHAVEDRYRPEMHRMERALVLQILDAAWKDHLLAMDHLRNSVGLRGYAQIDPKVEYKREGMRIFDLMWNSVGERVTDLIFRMEQLDERFVSSIWAESQAIHDEAPPASEIAQQQQSAIDSTQGDQKIEPIRKHGKRVGRNDPCPCGSGKKFKNCCMRKGGASSR